MAPLERQGWVQSPGVFNCSVQTTASEGEGTLSPATRRAPCVLVMLYKYISNK